MENRIYYSWLNHKDTSQTNKKIMQEMSESERSIAFNEQPIAFGTAGVRAKMGPGNHYLNEKTYKQLASGYARYLKTKNTNKRKRVLVVHDNRFNGMFFTEIVATTLYENGITPVLMENNELLPTPIASYLICKMGLDGGINITASHNPKEYNGFKCYDETGSQILPDVAEQIVSLMPDWLQALNERISVDYKAEYVNKKEIKSYFKGVLKSLPKTKQKYQNVRLVYSSMHGTASYYMSNFLNKIGYKCFDVPTQNFPDTDFVNAPNCNPEDPISFERAIILSEVLNANIILASDPDADRLGIAIRKNGDWVFINGNQAGIIETYYKLMKLKNSRKTPVIISTYISNNLIDRIGKTKNSKIIRTPTGFKWIGQKINQLTKKELYINGFEEAIGALPSPLNRDKDSFQTAALILQIISEYASKSMDLIDILEQEIFVKYGHWFGETTSIKITGFDWRQTADTIFNRLLVNDLKMLGERKIYKKEFNKDASSIDYFFDNKNESWIKFRISGTEPKFKIYTNLYPKEDRNIYDTSFTQQLRDESNNLVNEVKKFLGI